MKTAILVISFGTSHLDALKSGIEPIEQDIARALPQCDVFRAFTSGFVVDKLKRQMNVSIDTPEEAVRRIAEARYDALVLAPTHVLAGIEYEKVRRLFERCQSSGNFKFLSMTTPLLYDEADYAAVAQIVADQAAGLEGNLLLMGHGSEHAANASYQTLQALLPEHIKIGCVEGTPELSDLLPDLRAENTRSATLMPLMIVAGDHAKNDMAGDDDDSWKSILEAEGFSVEIRMKGLGENPAIRALFVERVRRALNHAIEP